jgi:hypothetical protein
MTASREPEPKWKPGVREKWLLTLDEGIRYYVDVLEKEGIETCQSCQGGPGHCYEQPTVDFYAHNVGAIYKVASIATTYGLPWCDIYLAWSNQDHLMNGPSGRIVFRIDSAEFLRRDKKHAKHYFKLKKLGRPTH